MTETDRYFTISLGFIWRLTLLCAVFSLCGGFGVTQGWAQNVSDSTDSVLEGYALHRPGRTLYHYRIGADSTVYIRQGRAPRSDSTIAIPASTFNSIFQRVNETILAPERTREHLAIGYEDKYLLLQFSQRFDLYVLGALVFVLTVGGGILLWLWWRLSREQRRRAALARSRRHLAEGREKERKRLAQEIHDGPVQDLHGLHMQLNALSDLPNIDRLETVGDELMRVTGELRAMSADLHPPALHRFGLAAALRSHADRLRERHDDLHVNLIAADDCESLPDAFALSVFRIAQEAMNNAVQHGEATEIGVRLECGGQIVELEVVDDGTGFTLPEDWHALPDQDHYGLFGMLERAEALGATLDIDSSPGQGTQIRLSGSITVHESNNSASTVPSSPSA